MEHIPNSFNLARALQLPQKHLDPPLHHQSSLSAVSDAPSMASLAAVCRATARLSGNPAVGARGMIPFYTTDPLPSDPSCQAPFTERQKTIGVLPC